jgi:hypothetical protein
VFTLASVLCALAPSPGVLIGARFLQGVGGALTAAVILGMIVTIFPERQEQAKAIGVYTFVAVAGGSIGLLVGGVITDAGATTSPSSYQRRSRSSAPCRRTLRMRPWPDDPGPEARPGGYGQAGEDAATAAAAACGWTPEDLERHREERRVSRSAASRWPRVSTRLGAGSRGSSRSASSWRPGPLGRTVRDRNLKTLGGALDGRRQASGPAPTTSTS